MTYPANFTFKNGQVLTVTGVFEAGPKTIEESGVTAFLSLVGPKNGTYTAKRVRNGYTFFTGLFEKQFAILRD